MKQKQEIGKRKILLVIGICALICILVKSISGFKKEQFFNDFDAAREESRDNMDASQIYTIKEGDHVSSFGVSVKFDDDNLSHDWFHTNLDVVKVKMDAGFESLSIRERCRICNQIMEKVKPRLNEYYNNSRYHALFEKNKAYDYTIMYRGKSLYVYHDYEFYFYDTRYTYTFPSYGNMTVTVTGTKVKEFYEYSYWDGKLDEFADKYGSKKSENSTTTSPSNNSSSKKIYDPYDVHDYKSAQDFADDKYEEFYDYEDDYEDEDEAYDAAEDYWNDNY
ncbi:hypothetical protein [Butyrivibrio sp. VCB2001]|uniref:hypothetical protein n=1 Tax=Butyrivibrio sp. VCB2001 TaxID=1280667 RepID=UPI00047AAF96|nr:hypothetical protein [Butyrivibrio sp. VCB2001]